MQLAHTAIGDWDNAGVNPTADEIRAALARVVESPQFSGAERLRRFLTYVVDRAIEGRADELKEFVVATAVFDRDDTYDPRLDAVVRVEAGRLRSRLAEYYAEGGTDDPVAIRIPKGGYSPVFERRLAQDLDPGRGPLPPVRPARKALWAIGITGALVLAGGTALWSGWMRGPEAVVASDSLAVLPLDGDTGAVAESLSRALVGTGVADVVAHGRVRDAVAGGSTARQVAQEFRAAYTVEGNVRTERGLIIELVLVDARTSRKLWVQAFEGEASGLDALVKDAASAVAKEIGARRPGR